MKGKIFSVDLESDYVHWWRYNAYISLVCYDADSEIIDYCNMVDKIYDIEYEAEQRSMPADYPVPRILHVESTPCDHVVLYLYVIANTFPESIIVRDSPEFDADLIVKCDGVIISKSHNKVDQLGGMTIAERLISV